MSDNIAIIDETVAFDDNELQAAFDTISVDAKIEVCAAEFAAMAAIARLQMKISAGTINDYVIFTNIPSRYRAKAVTNNIIDCNSINIVKAAKLAKWVFTSFGREPPMQNNIWFIADPHFGHAKIIEYCHRPFADIGAMNAELVFRWNAKVKKDDVIWCLGDFALGSKDNVKKFVSQLNGKIKLVMGNHDSRKVSFYYDAGFYRVYDHPVLIANNILLSHLPYDGSKLKSSGMLNLYGHVHSSMLHDTITSNRVCCCVERWDYSPISWKEIQKAIAEANTKRKMS